MSSVEYLRDFVNERLTAAAEEIFGVFQRTIIQYKDEIDRQRRLLDIAWKSDMKLHMTDLPQLHGSNKDQEDTEHPQIKEEQEELCTNQEGEFVLKREGDVIMMTSAYQEMDHSEDQTVYFHPDDTLSAADPESVVNIPLISSVVSESRSDHQLLSHAADSQDGESESIGNAEPISQKTYFQGKGHMNNVINPNMSQIYPHPHTDKYPFKCDKCVKAFQYKSKLQRHMSVHTGARPSICKTCGKAFCDDSAVVRHMKIHTGEKPFACKTCGKTFRDKHELVGHLRRRYHIGEKPYHCKICGEAFYGEFDLERHMKVHSDEFFSL